jgi:hypothetical protein
MVTMPGPAHARRPEEDREDLTVLGEKKDPTLDDKKVSGKAAGRLQKAKAGIDAVKKVMKFGAGNQREALEMSQMNSTYRLLVMRTDHFWEMSPETEQLAAENPEAAIAAKAELAHGGNCGEHAWCAFQYLRLHAAGEPLAVSAKEGLDHAFVLMGNLESEPDSELVVSDPWPTRARACLWEDHFAFTPDRKKIDVQYDMIADGKSYKEAIKAGLRLSAAGKHYVAEKKSKKETEDAIRDEKMDIGGQEIELHVWDHPNTEGEGSRYNYVE